MIGQLRHTDPALTLRIYARQMARRDGERERLRSLVEGRDWAPMGTGGLSERESAAETQPPRTRKPRWDQGFP